MHPQDDSAFHFRKRAKSEDGHFDIAKNRPKINWLPQQRPLDYCKTYVSFIICMHASTIAETLVKIGSVVVEIFGEIGRFLPYRLRPYNASMPNERISFSVYSMTAETQFLGFMFPQVVQRH